MRPYRLRLIARRWSVFGISLPVWLSPRGDSYQYAEDGRFHFHVEIGHPFTGLIVGYRGWLVPKGMFCGRGGPMKTKELSAILERVESWPEAAQRQLADIALEIEQDFTGAVRLSPAERAGIERGLAAAREGRFATGEQVEAALAKFHQT